MDGENDSMEVIITKRASRTIGGIEYSFYCERESKSQANRIKNDLIEQGCKSSVSRADGIYVVWWAR